MTANPLPNDTLAISPSETVVLHPVAFAKPKGFGGRAVLLGEGKEAKVDGSALAYAAWCAAAVAVVRAGAVIATVAQTKALFGLIKGKELRFAPGSGSGSWPEHSIEAGMVRRVAGSREPVAAKLVFADLMEEDTTDPESHALQIVERGLARRDVVGVQEKTTLKIFKSSQLVATDATRAAAERSPAAPVQALLADFEREHPDLWKELRQAMKDAIVLRTEQADIPDRD